jgi:hypothetical protein
MGIASGSIIGDVIVWLLKWAVIAFSIGASVWFMTWVLS